MEASSLIFVAIVVGWLVYLLPQWVRRRDSLAAFRGGDRHSDGLRVLPRRHRTTAGPSTLPLLRAPHGVELLVDDEDDHENGFVYVPPARSAHSTPQQAEAAAMTSPRYPGRPDPADTDPSDTDPVDPLPGDASAGPSAPASVVAARRRAVVLLVLCVVTAVSWAATLLGPLPLPVTLVSSVLLVAYVAALRSLARRREALRASRRAAAAPEPLPAVRARRTEESVVAAHPAPVVRRTPPSAAPMLRHATRDDDSVVLEPVAALEDELVAYDADGGTWVPVPVPPPTYTLKPMAPRPEQPAPGSATQAAPAAPSAAGAQAVAGSSPAAAASSPAAVGATQSVSGTPDGGQDDRPERTALTPAEVRARVLAQPLDLDEVLERRRAVND